MFNGADYRKVSSIYRELEELRPSMPIHPHLWLSVPTIRLPSARQSGSARSRGRSNPQDFWRSTASAVKLARSIPVHPQITLRAPTPNPSRRRDGRETYAAEGGVSRSGVGKRGACYSNPGPLRAPAYPPPHSHRRPNSRWASDRRRGPRRCRQAGRSRPSSAWRRRRRPAGSDPGYRPAEGDRG